MRNIILVGFMGTGKTTVAKRLAAKLKMKYVSTDERIESKEAMAIKNIFAKKGEPYFREVETKVIQSVSAGENQVIDAGGGVIVKDENVQSLIKSGTLICLTATPTVILKRTQGHGHRPLLNVSEPLKRIEELLAQRAAHYAKADHCVDTSDKSVDEIVEEIIKLTAESR